MPYAVKKKGNKFMVENELTHKVFSKGTTKARAQGQLHILEGIKHGFVPLHSYHSKNIPRGGKRKVLEK